MDHFWFVLGAYAVGILVPLVLAAGAWARLSRATARLGILDPRAQRMGNGGVTS